MICLILPLKTFQLYVVVKSFLLNWNQLKRTLSIEISASHIDRAYLCCVVTVHNAVCEKFKMRTFALGINVHNHKTV